MSENNETAVTVMQPSNNALAIYLDPNAFKQLWQAAKLFSSSDIIPATFKGKEANCFIALEMASRMGINPFALMQNLYVLNGKPALESKFTIALINNSNMFVDPLEYEIVGEDAGWNKKNNNPNDPNYKVRAFATRKKTGKTCYGPWITWDMAIAEGWTSKNGSKWLTMASVMFMYRAASFFGKLYCPDLTFGMQTSEEIIDITPINGTVSEVSASKSAILDHFNSSESILPAATETVVTPVAEEKPAASNEKTTTKQPESPAEAGKQEPSAQVVEPSDTASAEEPIPADKLTFMYLDELSRMTGETQDDLIDTHSKGKFGCLADLMGALNDKTKLTMAYLNDVLVPVLKAKAAEVAEEQQEG